MKDVVFIGNLAFQTEYTLNGQIVNHCVGSAYFTSVAARLISKNIGVVVRIGEDCPLNKVIKILLDISGVVVVPGGKTARFYAKETAIGFEFTEYPGVSAKAYVAKYPKEYLKTKFIHLASMLPKVQLAWVNYLRKKVSKNTIISADMFDPYTKKFPDLTIKVLSKVDLAFINEKEYKTLKKYPNFALPHSYVLKLGTRGAIYISGEKEIYAKAPSVKAESTTGAGEVLAAVFLTLRAKGMSIEKSLKTAVSIASYSVEKVGISHLFKNKKVQETLTKLR